MGLDLDLAYPVLAMRQYVVNTLVDFKLWQSVCHVFLKVFYHTRQIHAVYFS